MTASDPPTDRDDGPTIDPAGAWRILHAALTDPALPGGVDLDDDWRLVEVLADQPPDDGHVAVVAGQLALIPPDGLSSPSTLDGAEGALAYTVRTGWIPPARLGPARAVTITADPVGVCDERRLPRRAIDVGHET